jgi:hypothetical protein
MLKNIVIYIPNMVNIKNTSRIRGIDIAKKNNFNIVSDFEFNNKICIFIRNYKIDKIDIKKLKKKNNILILDILDSSDYIIKKIDFFDAFITNNLFMNKYFKKPTYMIYHHMDEYNLKKIKINNCDSIKIYYCGTKEKTYYYDNFKELDILHTNIKNLLNEGYDGKIMFSCRKGYISSGDNHKVKKTWETSAKLATCCYFDNIFITSKSNVSLELLGDDYPYYISETDINNVKHIITKCKKDIEEKNIDYELAKKKLSYAKKKLKLNNLCKEYFKIIESN